MPKRMTDMLATNMAMEVNAARSRRKSVIGVSLFLYVSTLFDVCSRVNRIPLGLWTARCRRNMVARQMEEHT
jgi:hypothetical protein